MMVDQDPLFHDGLRAATVREPGLRCVGATCDGGRAVRMCNETRPDVVLVDSRLDRRAMLTQALIAIETVRTVVVLVSPTDQNAAYLHELLRYGADGVIDRAVSADRLAEIVAFCHYEGGYVAEQFEGIVHGSAQRRPPGSSAVLSARECQILGLIAVGLATKDIAESCFLSPETIRSHVKNTLRKLGARNRAHAIMLGHAQGILGHRPGSSGSAKAPV
ncbi:response regulator transcription factor [Amycolatopsis sp. NPDC049868]|uniref:response regulator transcription factor n=1 Tax=Amycolatopsis sp. NPDC049868 TaxID=3363934 RepID=UPI0037A1CC4B